jgi:CheY-like chemotaxis protein
METQSAPTKKRHVLVVDDEVELTLAYKQFLEANDYTVTTAPNGVIALKSILNRDVDAVVCDLKMPQLGRRHVLRHRREDEAAPV